MTNTIRLSLDDKLTRKTIAIADYMNLSIPSAIKELIESYHIPKNRKGGQD